MSTREVPQYALDLLNRVSEENGFSDYSLHIKNGCQFGDGFTTDLVSVKISENQSVKCLDLVCKLMPLNENRQKEFSLGVFFEREATFYQKLMPCFAKFQQKRCLLEEDQFLAYPKCYGAIVDHENAEYVIVLEDLRPQGFKMWKKGEPSAIENVQLTMRELGKFHGLSIAMKHQHPEEFAEFKKLSDFVRSIFKTPLVSGLIQANFERAIDLLKKEDHKNIIRDLKENTSSYYDFCLDDEATAFGVLSHGDLWANNILYHFNQEGSAENVCILDWQLLRYVSPAIDIVFNIFLSTNKELRDREYDNLLRLYYNSLAKTVRLLGSNPDELFTFDDLQNELKLFGKFVLFNAPGAFEVFSANDKDELNLDEFIDKAIDKAANGETQVALTPLDEEGKVKCEQRLQDVIEDILRLGYFKKTL